MQSVLDLHLHSSASFDSDVEPLAMMEAALAAGLTHIAVTDHDVLEGAFEARDSALPGLTVIVGQEVRTVVGDVIALYVSSPIPSGRPLEQTVAAIRSQGGIVGLPHPFDSSRPSVAVAHVRPAELDELARLVDYIEVHNGRVTDARANGRAAEFVHATGVPGVAASDAHHVDMVGRCAIVVDGPIASADDLRRALTAGVRLRVREPMIEAASAGSRRRLSRLLGRKP